MPDVPNCAFAQFETNDTTTNRNAKMVAEPSSSGLPPVRASGDARAAKSGDGFAYRNCTAQIARPAIERPQSAGANCHARVLLKDATIARIRRYMIAVASVMPA